MPEFNILTEVERLVGESREGHLARAKASYIRRIQTAAEVWLTQVLVTGTTPFDKDYPEIEAWAMARSVDIALNVSEALARLMQRELQGWTPEASEQPSASEEKE